ncbi:restriction endonuclease subunit S [Neisseria elongata]|uniref:restriction endonuclease subunit S n=1 Tax=Neisseria elongata TaxID=495 RepID=UPI0024B07C43|nr:restriction endonuclease subunit S [Neisseria elongata]
MTAEQQLPEGWKETTLGAEFEWSSGGTPKSGVPAYYENGSIHWLNISDLNDGLISYAEKKITELGLQESSAKIVPQGSVLIAIYGSIGKLGINTIPLATNQAICFTKKIPEYILNKFLFYYLLSIRNQLISMGKGGTQQNISQTVLKSVPFLYPTSKETQQAIVNKIESLFDEIDEGIGRLKTAARQIQQYRQSLLKNAFSGELTKEWRSKHADTLPSENELLAQIQTTREQHHTQQLADWQTAVSQWEQNGKEGKKPSKPKAPTQAVKFEDNFADLPRGWGAVKLENLASEYVLGKMLDKNKNKGEERPYLGNINVRWGYFEFSNAKTMKIEDDEIERYSVKYGDLIICEGGEPGRCAVWKHEAEMFIQKALHRVRFPSYYSADFAFYYLSYAVKLPLVTDLLTGTTIKHLTGTALKNIPFPVCSINEQTQIVAILETKLTACDQLAAELAKQLKQAELLKQAVLKAAFSGSLLDK